MIVSTLSQSIGLFFVAGLCEIGGGWLIWQWFREGRSWSWGLTGGLVLIFYGASYRLSNPLISDAFMQRMADSLSSCLSCGVGFLTVTSLTASTGLAQL
jgi:hypothetical protein